MGNHIICRQCFSGSVSPQESKKMCILVVGLDNAGKTTAAKSLTGEAVSSPAPTLGFSRLEFARRGWTVQLFDVGGGRGIRGIWRHYLAESHGLAFVVDAADAGRLEESRAELHALLADQRVQGKPVLVLANKQDAQAALDEVELNERLQLEAIANRHRCPMRIELCAARPPAEGGDRHPGVRAGFHWLVDYVIANSTALAERVAADLAAPPPARPPPKPPRRQRELLPAGDALPEPEGGAEEERETLPAASPQRELSQALRAPPYLEDRAEEEEEEPPAAGPQMASGRTPPEPEGRSEDGTSSATGLQMQLSPAGGVPQEPEGRPGEETPPAISRQMAADQVSSELETRAEVEPPPAASPQAARQPAAESSDGSQLSAQLGNGIEPPKRRNRFFKRYTRTAPMPEAGPPPLAGS